MQSDSAAAAAGGVGLTAPLWFQFLDPVLQFLIAALGLFVLALTVWNKWLEIRIKRAALQERQEAEHGETRER